VLLTQGWYRNVGLLAFLAFFMFGLLLLQAAYIIACRRNLRRLRIVRRVPERIFAREPFFVELEIENPGPRQLSLRIEDRSEEGRWQAYVPALRRGEKVVLRQRVVIQQRGRYRWSALSVSTGFPFGLLRREVTVEAFEERVVYPAVGEVQLGHIEGGLQCMPPRTMWREPWHRPFPGAEFEFHRLREYRSGDSPRYVHWRSSARVGKLLVREMEPPATESVVVVLEAWRPADHPSQAQQFAEYAPLEDAVSLAATILMTLNRESGRRIGLLVLDAHPRWAMAQTGTTGYWTLLEHLAVVRGRADGRAADWFARLPEDWSRVPAVWVASCPEKAVVATGPLTVAIWANVHDPAVRTWYRSPRSVPLASRKSQDILS
jgi:uncharacterized protein (DUF58 family)